MCSFSSVGKNRVPSQIGRTEQGHCLSNEFVAMGKATTGKLLCVSDGNQS